VGVVLRSFDQTLANRVHVLAATIELLAVEYEMIGKPALPYGELGAPLGAELVREAAFDPLHRPGEIVRVEQQVNVVGHHDKGVELIETFGAVVLQRLDEESGVSVILEDSTAVVGDGGDEEGARVGGSRRVRHAQSIIDFVSVGENGRASEGPSFS